LKREIQPKQNSLNLRVKVLPNKWQMQMAGEFSERMIYRQKYFWMAGNFVNLDKGEDMMSGQLLNNFIVIVLVNLILLPSAISTDQQRCGIWEKLKA